VSEFEHTQIVREMFDAWNSHDVARYSTVLHAACTVEWTTRRQSARGDLVGSETASAAMRQWLSIFPDLHFDVEATASSGGRPGRGGARHRDQGGRRTGDRRVLRRLDPRGKNR